MFDMGFFELFLISVIALIVLGPERLPKAARTVGLWVGKAKQGFESIKTEIDRELKVKELQQQLEEQKKQLEADLDVSSEVSSLKENFDKVENSIQSEVTSLGQDANSSAAEPENPPSKIEQSVDSESTEQLESKK